MYTSMTLRFFGPYLHRDHTQIPVICLKVWRNMSIRGKDACAPASGLWRCRRHGVAPRLNRYLLFSMHCTCATLASLRVIISSGLLLSLVGLHAQA